MTTTIRLEIWVGTPDAEDGHVQELNLNDLMKLSPVIGEEMTNSLVDDYISRTSDDQ